MSKREQYRQKAAAILNDVGHVRDGDERQKLLKLAEGYIKLAEIAGREDHPATQHVEPAEDRLAGLLRWPMFLIIPGSRRG